MNFVANQNDLIEILNVVEKAVPTKTPFDNIKGILVEAGDDTLKFTANNLELAIQGECPWAIVEKEGSIVLPEKLVDIIRQFPPGKVQFKTDDEGLRTEILNEKTRFFLYGMQADDYPLFTEEEQWRRWQSIELKSLELKVMLKNVLFAASQDEKKPLFRGILIEMDAEGNISCTGTDTYRLAHNIWQPLDKKERAGERLRILVPGKTLQEVLRVLQRDEEKVEIFFQENEIIFKYQNFIFSGRLLEDKFPNFTNAFPAECETKITINRDLLEKALMRASLLVQNKNFMISLAIADKSLLINSGSEIGRMSEELSLEKKQGGDLEEIFLNCKYLLDVLRVLDDEFVEIEFNGPFGPCIFNSSLRWEKAQNIYRYLVLPIKMEKR